MRHVLIHGPGAAVDTVRTQNVGYAHDEVVTALARLDTLGHTHTEIVGTELAAEQLGALKRDVRRAFVAPYQKRGRKIGNSFGTNSQPWQDFGTGIPVLLVYDQDRCVDVYPHTERNRTVTIRDYLLRVVP
jgi:hypothetical protein